jgi:uncharacterized phiE125 gp8 family phage protein
MVHYGYYLGNHGGLIRLPRPPLVSVQSVVYTDPNGVQHTLTANTDYWVDTLGVFGSIRTKRAIETEHNNPSAVVITYTAGYGATADLVPADAKQAIRMLVAHWYQNREATGSNTFDIPLGYDSLVDGLRVISV